MFENLKISRRACAYLALSLATLGLVTVGPVLREKNARQVLVDFAHMPSLEIAPEQVTDELTDVPEYSTIGGANPRMSWRLVEGKNWVLFNAGLAYQPAYCPEILPYVKEFNNPRESHPQWLNEVIHYSLGETKTFWAYVPRFNARPDRFTVCAAQGFGYDAVSGRLTYRGKSVALVWTPAVRAISRAEVGR